MVQCGLMIKQEYVKSFVQDFYKEKLAEIKSKIKEKAEHGLNTEKDS